MQELVFKFDLGKVQKMILSQTMGGIMLDCVT